jgi:GAF domain-containing protein
MSPDGGEDTARKPAAELLDFARRFASEWSDRALDPKELVDFASIVDAIEYECGEGPCLDAIEYDDITVANDLAHDERWPKFVERSIQETSVRSMFGTRIFLSGKDRGALNFYADEPNVFDQLDIGIGAMLSTIASVALQHSMEQQRRVNLEIALESSRVIGMAMGIIMSSHLVTADQAFDTLRRLSQESNRKLRDVAFDVAETGALPQRRSGNGTA